jgi:hypothetical protein
MGGSEDAIEVFTFGGATRLSGSLDDATADASPVLGEHEFDARNAHCALQQDEARLVGVIDAYPGGMAQFNTAVLSALRKGEVRAKSAVDLADVSGRGDTSMRRTVMGLRVSPSLKTPSLKKQRSNRWTGGTSSAQSESSFSRAVPPPAAAGGALAATIEPAADV